MSKPLKQVVIYAPSYVIEEDVEARVNAWLSDKANDAYEHRITFFGSSDNFCAAIEYWTKSPELLK